MFGTLIRFRYILCAIVFCCVGTASLLAAQRTPPLTAPTTTTPTDSRTVVWRHDIPLADLKRAQIVRVSRGVRTADLAALKDDQLIETPSGARLSMGRLRAIQTAFAQARAHTAVRRTGEFAILPPAKQIGAPPKPGETAAEILARPPSDVIRLPSGHSITVAQLRLMVPYIKHHFGIDPTRAPKRPGLTGPAAKVTKWTDLKLLPRNAPDDTIIESPSGTRITLGELKVELKARFGVPQGNAAREHQQ